MRTADIKDIKRMNKGRVRRKRPRGCPSCFLFLKRTRVVKENQGVLDIPNGATVLGAYGVKNENGNWMYLVKEGQKYVWIYDNAIKEIFNWTEDLQAKFDNKQFETQPDIVNQEVGIAASEMIILLKVNGQPEELKTDFRGKLQTPKDGFTTMKDYLAHLMETHGTKAVSYEYQLQ